MITPIIAAIFGQPDFSSLKITIGDSAVADGSFINTIVSFVIIGAVLFVIVEVYERMKEMRSPAEKAEEPSELNVLTRIRDLLRTQQGTA